MPETETGQAVQVLDLLLEYFGDQGERWTRDRYDDGDGRRCLVGALSYLRGKHRLPSESAECFLHEAMKQVPPHRRGGLVYFNDRCRNFAELRSVIVEARTLALGETDRQRAAAAVERWLLAELGRERAARAGPPVLVGCQPRRGRRRKRTRRQFAGRHLRQYRRHVPPP
jgi:hypothetical protein